MNYIYYIILEKINYFQQKVNLYNFIVHQFKKIEPFISPVQLTALHKPLSIHSL